MRKKTPPAAGSARRVVGAIQELTEFVKANYWETIRPGVMLEADRLRLFALEGKLLALMSEDGRYHFQPDPPQSVSREPHHGLSLTGAVYFYVGDGTQILESDYWELKMHAALVAYQTFAELDESSSQTHPNRTSQAILEILREQPKGKGLNGKEIVSLLAKRGIEISEDTFRRHHVASLKKTHGLVNHPAAGGYMLE